MTPEREARIASAMARRQRDLHAIIENVDDPHNLGAILRSCDAVGVGTVHLIYHPSTELGAGSGHKTPNMRDLRTKAAASAAKWLEIKTWRSVEECVAFLRSRVGACATHVRSSVGAGSPRPAGDGVGCRDMKAGFPGIDDHDGGASHIQQGGETPPLHLYVATLSSSGHAPWDLDLASPCVIAVGNEHEGPTVELVRAADGIITIPMQGFVESFNVSVAAAICLAEAMRQRICRGSYQM
ncbi:MAG TPA: RNA methyltransferase [Candidatus Methylomirabilis sp.]|nr:RNA methyltransferase [Candidatus Methylomirabilis sp.]